MHAYYAQRRKKLLAQIESDSVVILATHPQMKRSNDTFFPFRPHSSMVYFTGCTEPQTIMLLSHKEYRLFLRPKHPEKELWDGNIIGLEEGATVFDCETSDINMIGAELPKLLKQYTKVYFDFDNINTSLLETLTHLSYQSLAPLITLLRVFKDDWEITMMRTAAKISSEAHIQAMQQVGQCEYEFEVQSIFDAHFTKHNTEHAYSPIVAGGNNANTLHYVENTAPLHSDELLLIDAGCEHHYYASDITRTFPISGTFSKAQTTLYTIVLQTQQHTIEQVQPGTTIAELDNFAKEYMSQQLIALGLITTKAQIKEIFPHGIGHFLGLDVHDVGGKNIVLEPSMVLTIEPGIYIPFDAKIDEQFSIYKGIGIRIEDDVLVTSTGYEVLTKDCPKQIADIELLIQAH